MASQRMTKGKTFSRSLNHQLGSQQLFDLRQ